MFTDMVGYTTLGQKNESLSLALVDEQRKLIRPILGRHRGREIKTMGDAFLVEFQSALDAVRCAYDIQRAAREFNISQPVEQRIRLRVGVHLGDVVESSGDISGDAVNMASRIEPLAEDGGVSLTRQVYDQVRTKYELALKSLGETSLKNVGETVEVFKIVMPWENESAVQSKELDRNRIAVLPFSNMSSDPSDEYFADGMTEELITSLSGVNGLTVIARTSIVRYKNAMKPASEIGKELRAGTLVEGSVRKAGNRVRITVQLIDALNEGHMWARNYDKQLDDIFAIQSDVAEQVAGALQIKLLSSDRVRIQKTPTSNIEAYTLYLKGRYYANRTTKEGFSDGILHFEEAIANDPKFALAYVGLGFCYSGMGFFGILPSKEAGLKAKIYAKKALLLDDSLAEAHLVMGSILRNYDWDFAGAEMEYKRAMDLNPNLAEAYGRHAILVMFNRRFSDAVEEVKRALELDPISDVAAQYAATIYLYSRHYDDSIAFFTKALEIDPSNDFARGNRALAYVQKGMFDVAVDEMKKVATLKMPASQCDSAYVFAKASRFDEVRTQLEVLLREAPRNPELSVAVASAYLSLGDKDHSIEWLERAYDEHLAYLTSINADFIFDSLRSEPRFQELMKKVGFTNT